MNNKKRNDRTGGDNDRGINDTDRSKKKNVLDMLNDKKGKALWEEEN